MKKLSIACATILVCIFTSAACHAMGVAAPTAEESRDNVDSLITSRKSMQKSPAEMKSVALEATARQQHALESIRSVHYSPPIQANVVVEDPQRYQPIIVIGGMLASVLALGVFIMVATRRALAVRLREQQAMVRPRSTAVEAAESKAKLSGVPPPKVRSSASLQQFLETHEGLPPSTPTPVPGADEESTGLARKVTGNKSAFVSLAELRLEDMVPPKPPVPLKLGQARSGEHTRRSVSDSGAGCAAVSHNT